MKPSELQMKIAMGPNTIIEYFTPQQMADALEAAIDSAVELEVCERTAPYSKELLKLKENHLAWLAKIQQLRGK